MAEQTVTLDEQALRKPGFVEGARVKLGDGQEWSLPKSRMRFVPNIDPEGEFRLKLRPVTVPHRQADMDRMMDLAEADGESAYADLIFARCELTAGLLCDNYNLDDAALAALVTIDFGDEANRRMWAEIENALMGRA